MKILNDIIRLKIFRLFTILYINFYCLCSLGSALAVLYSAELHLKGLPINSIYTFGSPRIGN